MDRVLDSRAWGTRSRSRWEAGGALLIYTTACCLGLEKRITEPAVAAESVQARVLTAVI